MDGESLVFFLSYSHICKFYEHPDFEIRLSSFDNSHILLPITSLKKLKGASKVSIQCMILHLVIRLVFPYLKKNHKSSFYMHGFSFCYYPFSSSFTYSQAWAKQGNNKKYWLNIICFHGFWESREHWKTVLCLLAELL